MAKRLYPQNPAVPMQGPPRPLPSYSYQPPPSHGHAPTGFTQQPGYPTPTTGHFPQQPPPPGHQAGQSYDYGQGTVPKLAPPTGYPSVSMAAGPVVGGAPQPIPSHSLGGPPMHTLIGQLTRSSSGPPALNLAGPGPPTQNLAGPPLSSRGVDGPPVGGQAVAGLTTGVQQMHMVDPRGQGAPPSGPPRMAPPTSHTTFPMTSSGQGPPPSWASFGQRPPPTTTLGQEMPRKSSLGPDVPFGRSLSQGPPPMTSSGQGPPTTSVVGQGPPTAIRGPPPIRSLGQGSPPVTQGPPPMTSLGQGPPPTSSLGHSHSGLPTSRYPVGQPLPSAPPAFGRPVGRDAPPLTGQPPQGVGQPPPGSGQPPQGVGQPPQGVGQQYPYPMTTQAPPTGPPPPTSSQGLLTGPTGLVTGPPGSAGVRGQEMQPGRPPMGGMAGPRGMGGQPGAPTSTPGVQSPGPAVNNDPMLQPVNLLQTRDILPPTPLSPPEAVFPGGLEKFNPHPSVFCSTMNAVPTSSSVLGKLKLPFAIHIHPFKDMSTNECPVIHPSLIVRCRMCRAYINPFVTIVDSRHWRCNVCFRANALPEDFDYNPQTGRHGDRSHRMEIRRASVEYIAPSEYMLRPPQPCVYYFLIDVSFPAVESGVLGVFCRTLLDNLDRLPGDARTMVGILTYDSTLHFYNLKSSLSQPQMLVVSDLDDVFLPSPNSLLVNLRESKELIRTLLEDLPGMFATNRCLQSALGAALQAAEKLMHHIGGRVTVLQSSLPNIGPGALKYRDVAPSSLKLDTLNMAPASDFYKKLALDCSSQQIGVDVFAISNQFIDLSTISCIAKFSSGQVFYYPDFHHRREAPREKFEQDLKRYLTRKIGFEAVMRIRCTEGLSLHTFHGNFFVRSTDLLSLPNVNPDHGYTMNIAIDESLKEGTMAVFQAALLYTSSRGERRIRVHTLCLPVTKQLSQLYAKLDIQAITGTMACMAIDRANSASLGDAREALTNTVIDATKMFRSNFASSMQASQFTLPASLSLLPLFMLSLLKHPAFTLNSKVSYDVRTQAMNLIKSLPLDYVMSNIYPKMYALHSLTEKDVVRKEDGREIVAPPILPLTAEKMSRYGIFFMECGLDVYIWVSKDASQELIQSIFGVRHFGAIAETTISLPVLENSMSSLVNKLVHQVRASRQHFLPLLVIREDGPHRLLFLEKLVGDRSEGGTTYYEFLTHLNRQLSK